MKKDKSETRSKKTPASKKIVAAEATQDSSAEATLASLQPSTLGEFFRRARRQKSLKLIDAAHILKLRPEYLEAIEDGRFSELPQGPYARGFVQSYATFLGLDAPMCLEIFQQVHHDGPTDKANHLAMPTVSHEDRWPSQQTLVGAGIIALILIALGYWLLQPASPSTASSAPSPSASESSIHDKHAHSVAAAVGAPPKSDAFSKDLVQTPSATPIETTAPDEAQAAQLGVAARVSEKEDQSDSSKGTSSPQTSRLQIRATATSWVRLYDGEGKTHIDRILKLGDVLDAPTGLYLATGNAGGIEILLDDAVLPLLGKQGFVRRDLKLDPATIVDQLSQSHHDDDPAKPISAAKAKEPNVTSAKALPPPATTEALRSQP